MSRGKRWLERIKSLLILALTVSAGFLAWKTGLFQRLVPESVPVEPVEPTSGVLTYQAAARPVCAAVTGGSGLVYGVSYDDSVMDGLMQDFRTILGETLGSASKPVRVDEQVWREALLGPGLYLDYGVPVSLNVLACWMGTTAGFSAEQRAERLLFSLPDDERVDLYFMDERGNTYYSSTLALGSTLHAGIGIYLPNGAEFAMQLKELEACDPYALILRGLPVLHFLTASDSGRRDAFLLAAELCGIKLYSVGSFQEQEDTIYLGDEGRLRLEAGGGIRYTAAEGKSLGEARGEASQIELCRRLFAQLSAACGGVGELQYSGLQHDGDSVVYRFDYRVNGVTVKLGSGNAAWALFREGRLEEMGFLPRTYMLTANTVDRIPCLQAAAASGSMQAGSAPELMISDPGGNVLIEPIWTLRERSA